jgi:pimeloyl-ACP methyl ester carboxylesterase
MGADAPFDRPHRRDRYGPDEVDADLVAVLEAAGVTEAVVARIARDAVGVRLADAPRTSSPVCGHCSRHGGGAGYDYGSEAERRWQDDIIDAEAWACATAFWRTDGGYRVGRVLLRRAIAEPHSTKQLEDAVRWALDTEVEAMIAEREGRAPFGADAAADLCRRLQHRHRVLVIHGTDDCCQPLERGRRVAELTGGELVVLDGSGHLPHVRDPVTVSRLVRDFVDEATGGSVRTKVWSRSLSRRKRALYLSSPIGLGHARRDVAIAQELKRLQPDVEIDWLAQHPVTAVLEAEGERIHPGSGGSRTSPHIASIEGPDLHCSQAPRRMDEVLITNFMIFQDAVDQGDYDLVIADEAWDIDHFWHEHPELKRAKLAWLTDFVGYVPMPSGGEREAFLTTDYNAEMIEHIERHPGVRDRAIFVGGPEDIVPLSFGNDLPAMRDWVPKHFDFAGYVIGEHPSAFGAALGAG